MAGPIRLASDLTPSEVQKSAVARNALILLGAAATGPGLKMTATGNLSRDVVAEMIDRFTWPGFDETHAFQFHKVINEANSSTGIRVTSRSHQPEDECWRR
jgi:hypothetical protein